MQDGLARCGIGLADATRTAVGVSGSNRLSKYCWEGADFSCAQADHSLELKPFEQVLWDVNVPNKRVVAGFVSSSNRLSRYCGLGLTLAHTLGGVSNSNRSSRCCGNSSGIPFA